MASDGVFEPALALADRLRRREVSSEELVRASLERIDRLDSQLHAFVEVLGGRARAAARRWDKALAKGGDLPRFAGVPIGIKDVNFVRATRTRAGSRAFGWLWSPLDDRVVARLRAAGFVIVGKLATSELGATPVTEPDIHPPTRNPWNLEMTPGGSSGGSGAAVASGMVPIAHGSDGAGSIRIPASLCGLYGFKPSRGLVPEPVGRADPRGLAVNGPLARTVDDARAMLEVLSGQSLAAPPSGRLKVRVATGSPLGPSDPEIVAAVRRVAALLAERGHQVSDAPGLSAELDEFLPLWQRAIARAPVPLPSRLQPVTRWLRDGGKILDPGSVDAAQDKLTARILDWFGDADLMLTPGVPVRPPAIGAWKELAPREMFARAAELGAFTAPFNITGQPAAAVPAGVGSWGVPIAVQLAGKVGADALVLAISAQLEEAMPWIDRRPPI